MQEERWNLPTPNNLQDVYPFRSQNQHTNQLQHPNRTSAQLTKQDQSHSIISLCDSPTVKLPNSPDGQAIKDYAQESKPNFDTSLVRHTYSFPAAMYSAPYQTVPTGQRRRSDLIGYPMDFNDNGPLFNSQKQMLNMYTSDRSNEVKPKIGAKFDRGFFLADNDWTCYRRNYFQISAAFTLQGSRGLINEQDNPLLFIELQNQSNEDGPPTSVFQTVVGFSIGLTAKIVNSEKRVELVQHTPKRDKGPQSVPAPRAVKPGGNLSLTAVGANHNIVTFERVQFKTATANNGKRRAAQQYYTVVIDLHAITGTGEMLHVMEAYSQPLVVRGRSPGHYVDSSNLQRQIERYNSLPLGPPLHSADERYFNPTQLRHARTNDPQCRPYSPYSPYPPFSPATPVVATPSSLRNSGDLSLLMSPNSPYPSQFPTHNYLLPSITGAYYTSSPDMFSTGNVYDSNHRNDIAGDPMEQKFYHQHNSHMGLGLQGVPTGREQGRRDATNGKEFTRPSTGTPTTSAMDSYAHNLWVSRSRTDSMASIASFASTQSGHSSDENDANAAPNHTQSFAKPSNVMDASNGVNATSYLPAISEVPSHQGYDLGESYSWDGYKTIGSDAAAADTGSHHLEGYHSDNESTPYNTIPYPSSSSNTSSAHIHTWNSTISLSPPLPSHCRTETGHKILAKSKSLGYIPTTTASRHPLQKQYHTYTYPAATPSFNYDGVRPRVPGDRSLKREGVVGRRSEGNIPRIDGNGPARHDAYQYYSWINDAECEPAANANACATSEAPPTPTAELTTIITNLGFRMGRMEDGDSV